LNPETMLDGKRLAGDIKGRCKKIGRTVKSVCLDAKVSYRTYCSWQQGEKNPSFASLKRIYAVLGGKC
jgi:transcriptional regulator with XRE-family HTH domain